MDDFDTFKVKREKTDPSARKMTAHQWQQAYAAYQSSRERLAEGKQDTSTASSGSGRRSARRSRQANSQMLHPSVQSRGKIRHNSAYSDLRTLLDFLSWVAIGLIVLTGAVKLVYYTSASATILSLLGAGMQIILVVFLRLLVHVIIDIPDIALQQRIKAEK